jgi:hypothetical protein
VYVLPSVVDITPAGQALALALRGRAALHDARVALAQAWR